MWKQLVESLTAEREFSSPASWAEVTLAEEKLGVRFPDDLRNLLFESNGIMGPYELGLVWPVDRIVADNAMFRENEDFKDLYMPFDSLLFFADAGNGDQFAYPIQNGSIQRPDVFVWKHEEDSRCWVAPSLTRYLEWWLNGTMTL